MRILLIEDDKELLTNLLTEVEKDYIVDVAYNGVDGSYMSQINDYDVMVVDATLPDMDGIELCKTARKEHVKAPIILLSKDFQPQEKAKCLDAGADVNLIKPLNALELKAQMRALTRRSSMFGCEPKTSFGDLEIDFINRQVFVHEKPLPLRRKEFDLLEYMVSNKGKIVSKEELLEHVWEDGLYVFSNSVEVHIRSLRKRFLECIGKRVIKTVRGFGYKFEI